MCFISTKKWNSLQETINELNSIIKNNELEKLRTESDELKEIKDLLSNISFKVKTIRSFVDDNNGLNKVQIVYELPTITIEFENGKQVNTNEFFKSVNLLDLIGLEDKVKIQNELQKAKERSQNNGWIWKNS